MSTTGAMVVLLTHDVIRCLSGVREVRQPFSLLARTN
jgi:hypothetical protein